MSTMIPLTAASQAIQPDRRCCFDLQTISELSNFEIRGSMTKDELIQIIRNADYPFAGKERLEFFNKIDRVPFELFGKRPPRPLP